MIDDEEKVDVQSMLEQMVTDVENDPVQALIETIKVLSAVVVSVSQLSKCVENISDGLDDCMSLMDDGIFSPFANEHRKRQIDELKGVLSGENRDFSKYEDFYKSVFDKSLLDETAEKLLDLKAGLEEGAEFDQEKWLNDEYSAVENKYNALKGMLGGEKADPTTATGAGSTESPELEEVDLESGLSEEAIKKAIAQKIADLN